VDGEVKESDDTEMPEDNGSSTKNPRGLISILGSLHRHAAAGHCTNSPRSAELQGAVVNATLMLYHDCRMHMSAC